MERQNDSVPSARIGDSSVLPVHLPVVDLASQQGARGDQDPAVKLAPVGVGIDCHSRFIQVCLYVQTPSAEYLRYEETFLTTWDQLQAGARWARAIIEAAGQRVPNGGLAYTLESTGCYHLPVCLAWGGTPSVVNPTLAAPTRRKTDVLDARLLAYHALTGLWAPSYLAPRELQTLRLLLMRRRRQMQRATQALNRLNNLLLRFGHTLGSQGPLNRADIRPVVEDLAAGRALEPRPGLSPIPLPPLAAELAVECYAEYDVARKLATETVKQARHYAASLTFHTEAGELSGKDMLKLLETCPGVGQVTALVWLAQVGDWRRFPNAKATAAYAGCDPSLKVSAGHVTSQNRRRGNEVLHTTLVQAAQYLVRTGREPLGQWGRRMWLSRGKGGWPRAVGAVARRLAVALYWVMRRGEAFSYAGYRLAAPTVPKVAVGEMGLSKRALKQCEKHGWKHSQDILTASAQGLQTFEGVGPAIAAEMAAWLKEHATWTEPASMPGAEVRETSAEVANEADKADKADEPNEAMGRTASESEDSDCEGRS